MFSAISRAMLAISLRARGLANLWMSLPGVTGGGGFPWRHSYRTHFEIANPHKPEVNYVHV